MSQSYRLSRDKLKRSRLTRLTRMLLSGELSDEAPRELMMKERIDRWMVNEGYRKLTVGLFVLVHGMIFAFGLMNYGLRDNLTGARSTFGITYPIARSAALVLHFDIALILFPVCRTLISLMRQTPLNGIIQFDKNIAFHKMVAWSIVFFTWLHTIAHWNNFAQFAAKNKLGFKGFILANFATGPGWSGYVMLIALMVMVYESIEKRRRANYERFWNMHHLFVIFFVFWSIHGAFCMIKPDFKPFCAGTGVFWEYWTYGGFVYLAERILREIRGRRKTIISKVVQHPSNVVEIQIQKGNIKTRPGQYIFLCCPEVSVWQYHPFTLTSAPEEDYISIHMRCVGDFTSRFAKTLGCIISDMDDNSRPEKMSSHTTTDTKDVVDPSLNCHLPRICIDGPFGSASEDVFKYEIAVLVGAGIGATPFASILKSIWYRMNFPRNNGGRSQTRLRKVYFFWICRDFGSFEWFRSLLLAIEQQDLEGRIEICTYLTAKISPADATNIMLHSAGNTTTTGTTFLDPITGLRSATSFGRPNWHLVFRSLRKIHSPAEIGTFFCGPKALGSELHAMCNMYSGPECIFRWGKENF